MRPGRDRVARIVVVLATSALAACTSTETQTRLRTAEAAADVRTFAGDARTAAPAGDERTAAATPAPRAIDEATLEQPLDLASLEAAAIARHPSLVAAAHRVRALVERARAEGRLPPPELMAEIWQVPFAKPYALDKAGMIMFSVRQPFPAAGMLERMSEAMAHEAQAEVAKASTEARTLVREVDRAFASYAEATARRAAHDAHLGIVEQMVASARVRYSTGGSLGDFTRAELERARVDVDVARERGMIDEARVKLNGLLARPLEASLGPPRWADARTVALTPERAAEIAASASPEIAMAEHMEKAARAAAQAADREASVPMFSVGLDTFLPVNGTPAGYGASFAMSLPWVWGAASGRAKSAEQKALAERATAAATRLRMRTDAAMALTALRAAERRYLILLDSAAPAAQRALSATRAGYATGIADILMWLDASRVTLDVDLDLAMARGDLERALADLDWAAGGHLPRAPLSNAKDPGHAQFPTQKLEQTPAPEAPSAGRGREQAPHEHPEQHLDHSPGHGTNDASAAPVLPAPPPAPPSPVRPPRRFGLPSLILASTLSAAAAGPAGYLLAVRGSGSSAGADATHAQYQCPMHPTIVQDHPGECPICGMKLVKMGAGGGNKRKINFYRSPMDPKRTSPGPAKDEMGMDFIPVYDDENGASSAASVPGLAAVDIDPERQQLIGLKTVEVTRGRVSHTWRTVGRVAVDETRVRHVNIKVPVYVERVHVNFVGKAVKKGAALFSGYSPELLTAQEEYRVALAASKGWAGSGSSLGGVGFLAPARRKLELLDVPKAAIERLERGEESLKTLTFSSPISGVVTKKDVVDGMKLEAGAMPYEIVDLSRVWVLADIYETDLHRVRIGMPATLRLKAFPNQAFEGSSIFLDPVVDPRTRTVKLRLEFPNPNGDLRPDLFGEVLLETARREALRIPEDAIIDSGTRKVVFVALGEGKLQPREVVLGESDETNIEVVSGLSAGEKVVVRANFLVDSESRLRASLAALSSAAPAGSATAAAVLAAPPSSAAAPERSSPAPTGSAGRAPRSAGATEPKASAARAAPSADAGPPASKGAEYACPMHPEVKDDKASRCPKCGMNLTPVGRKPE